MKRVLLRSGKSPFHVASPGEIISQDLIGTNTGNLVFSDAAHKLLSVPDVEVTSAGLRSSASTAHARELSEKYDVFVVPLANAFRVSFQDALDRLSSLIEKLTIPVVILGVGAQAGTDYDTVGLTPLNESVRRFARAVLEKSPSIGVRGELTADYLRSLGFRDVQVIGCPSMFYHGETFPSLREPAPFTADSPIAINLSPYARRVGEIGAILRKSYKRHPKLTYFAQNLADAELLFWGHALDTDGAARSPRARLMQPLLADNRVRVPLDTATWMEELRSFDFSFGTRIHGNIVALLAGTPSVVLAHDSRTLELCRYFDIPHRLLADVPRNVRPEDLYAAADYTRLVSGQPDRFRRFADFLDEHSLANTYDSGDRGAAFEERLAKLDLPSSLEVWTGGDDGHLRDRISVLRRENQELLDELAELRALVTVMSRVSDNGRRVLRRLSSVVQHGKRVVGRRR